MNQKDITQFTKLIYTADNPIQKQKKGHGTGQGNDKFNVKGKLNNRANMNYRTDYSCNKCKIPYSTHKDWVYHNRPEHLKTKCTKCDLNINGENNKQIHERQCKKDNKD